QVRLAKWINLETIKEQKAARASEDALHTRPSISTPYVEPRSDTERTIAGVWERNLGVSPIGVQDKFFELGGHSLLAVQLISELRDAFRVELSAQKLFEAPTVAQLAEIIEREVTLAQGEQARREEEKLAEMLALVEGMSDEQVAELLSKEAEL